jgi:hypothetical protein
MRRLDVGFIETSLASPLRSRHLSQIATIHLLSEQKDGKIMRPFAAPDFFAVNRVQFLVGRCKRRKRKYPTRNAGLALCHLSGDCHD